jgi:hypothetical protein
VAFAGVADPRRRQGRRYALAALLTLAVMAILCNHLSVLAIAEWAQSQDRDLLRSLGFGRGATPCQSTLQRLFARLDPDALGAALTRAFGASATEETPRARGSQGGAIDGKAPRGRLARAPAAGVVHEPGAYCHDAGLVLAAVLITSTAEKAEAELTVVPALLDQLDWAGRVLTGDALFCQRHLCVQILAAGGDYLVLVQENPSTLRRDIALPFDPPYPALPLADRRRSALAGTDPASWPGAA